ncbi:MAG: hypothetical protein ABJA61_00285 [Caldimonas sp.]
MSLLAQLNLRPPATMLAKQCVEAASAEKELMRQIKQAWEENRASAREAGNEQMLAVIKTAAESRKKAEAMADPAKRTELLKNASERAREEIAAARKLLGLKKAEKEKELAQGETKRETHAKGGIGQGKVNGDVSREVQHMLFKGKSGSEIKAEAVFGNKGSLKIEPVPFLEPPEFDVTFEYSQELELGLKGKAGKWGKAGASGSVKVEVSLTRHIDSEAVMKAYGELARAGQGGGFAELRLAAAVASDHLGDIVALINDVRGAGGSVGGLDGIDFLAMAEGDKYKKEIVDEESINAGVSGVRGAASISSGRTGKVSREVSRKSGKWVIVMSAENETQSQGSVGASSGLVGMSGSKDSSSSTTHRIQFELDETDADLADRFRQIMAAATMAQMKSLRTQLDKVKSTELNASSQGEGGSAQIDVAGQSLGVAHQGERMSGVLDGAQGDKVHIEGGAHSDGASVCSLGRTLAGGGHSESWLGTSNDEEASGQSEQSDDSADLFDSAKALAGSALKMLGVATGQAEFLQQRKHLEADFLPDESFRALVRLARNKDDWDHCGLQAGDNTAYFEWAKLRGKVDAAKGNRNAINAALADLNAGHGRGLHNILTYAANMSGKTTETFELPQALAKRKELYESFVLDDPVEEAMKGTPAKAAKKLAQLAQQVEGLRNEILQHMKEFRGEDVALDMCGRLDQTLARVRRAQSEAEESASEGSEMVSRAGGKEAMRKRAEAIERVTSLKRRIDAAHATEQAEYADWQDHLGGDKKVLLGHRDRVFPLHSKWRALIAELGTALQEAGEGYDPREAGRVAPDETTLKVLQKMSRF